VTPALITATGIAASGSIYGSQVAPGSAFLSGVLGADVVKADVALENVSRSSSGNVNAGAYKQTLTNLSGQDASNYTWAPFSTTVANYVVTPLVLRGSITAASTNAGSLLTPGVATLTNVIAGDALSVSEVVVAIPGAVAGSKTGNVVGTFAGSQKIASLSGADSANYDSSKVVGDYSVKTGFSSGTVYPREMSMSFVKTNSSSQTPSELSLPAQASKATTSQVMPQKSGADTEASNTQRRLVASNPLVSAPAVSKVALISSPIKKPPTVNQTLALSLATPSANSPTYASSFLGESAGNLGMSNVYNGESSEVSTQRGEANQEDMMAPIYAVIRELLASPTTYQAIGAASSIVLLVKTLVTPAMTTVLNGAPTHSPSRAPIRTPFQSSSYLNNQSNFRFARRA
jgi:hypothetical protein